MSYLQPTEVELLERMKAGDVEAFNSLFHTHWQPLYRTALARTDNEQAAFDIVQDIFIQLWLHRDAWSIQESLIQYLQGAVRNQVFNYYRKSRRETEQLKALSEVLGGETPGDSHPEPSEADAREIALERAVEDLPDRMKDVYILRIRYTYSFRAIAAALNIKPQTAKNAYSRALVLLRDKLAESLIIVLVFLFRDR